jgi:hypothetical protein
MPAASSSANVAFVTAACVDDAYVAGDPAIRARMPTLTAFYDEIWDAMCVLLLIGFVIGSTPTNPGLSPFASKR